MLIRSSHPWALILLACKVPIGESEVDEPGQYFYKFPNDGNGPPGILAKIDTALPVLPQSIARIEEVLSRKPLVQTLEFVENYTDELQWDQEPVYGQVSVYVARWLGFVSKDASKEWATIPDLLRALPSGKLRLTYLRAFQVMQGGLNQDLDAIDTKDLQN